MSIVFHGLSDRNLIPLLDIPVSLAILYQLYCSRQCGCLRPRYLSFTAHTLLRLPSLRPGARFQARSFNCITSNTPSPQFHYFGKLFRWIAGAMLICEECRQASVGVGRKTRKAIALRRSHVAVFFSKFKLIKLSDRLIDPARATEPERHLRLAGIWSPSGVSFFFKKGEVTSSLALEIACELQKDPLAELQPKSAVLSCCSVMEREELVFHDATCRYAGWTSPVYGKAFPYTQVCDVCNTRSTQALVETSLETFVDLSRPTPGFFTAFNSCIYISV